MPARQMTVCFSGYRPEKLPWGYDECDPRCAQLKQRLRRAICAACDDGFRHFICGMARGVDTYCAEIVLALRPQYPDLTLEAAIPCPSQCGGWTPDQQARWHAIVDRCDFETVVQDHYGPGCMQRRNRYMVDHAARLIAVFDGQEGGTRRTVEYRPTRRETGGAQRRMRGHPSRPQAQYFSPRIKKGAPLRGAPFPSFFISFSR